MINGSSIWGKVLSWIFPDRCVACSTEGALFCADCLGRIEYVTVQKCPICKRSSENGRTCPSCQNTSSLSFLLLGTKYSHRSIVALFIQTLKYKGMKRTIQYLPEELLEIFKRELPRRSVFLVPVPLHKKRLAERGFNQAEVLAKKIGERAHMPVCNVLRRDTHTSPQAKLAKAERLTNVRGAFSIAASLPTGIPVLVDDVATTLSTLQECATVLKEAGYEEVGAIAIARG